MDFIKFAFPISVILAVIIVVRKHVKEYKAIRRKNPGMTAGQAFEQHMNSVNAQAAEERRERTAIWLELYEKELAENARLAEETAYHLRAKGAECIDKDVASGKVYYRYNGSQYSCDVSGHYSPKED